MGVCVRVHFDNAGAYVRVHFDNVGACVRVNSNNAGTRVHNVSRDRRPYVQKIWFWNPGLANKTSMAKKCGFLKVG